MLVFVNRSFTEVYRFRIPVIHWYRIADFNRFNSLSVGFFADFDFGAVLHGCSLLLLLDGLTAEWLACRSTAALPLVPRPPAIIPHCQGVERADG